MEKKNSENIIELKNIKKSYDGNTFVVEDFNLEIKKGEFVTFLGPSGCGKTTTLRMIAGFESPTEGEILLKGEDISKLPPFKRPINTVFQRYALFPHLNVFDNVAFGLKLKKMSRKETVEKVHKALAMVDLEGFDKRSVTTLSGGQQQRIAIARAIVNEPEILLLDEPLGALDLKMRKEMQIELKSMHKELGITFIYVTHDQEEALTMSDKVVVMSDGLIQQIGTPEDIYNEPKNAFVADFIGESNIFNGRMVGQYKVEFCNQVFTCVDDYPKNVPVEVVVRPEDIEMVPESEGMLKGLVTSVTFKGVHHEITVECGKYELVIQSTKSAVVGSTIGMNIGPNEIHVMEYESPDNVFDGVITKNGTVSMAGGEYPCDLTQLFTNAKYNEDRVLVDNEGKEIEVAGTEVLVTVPVSAMSMSDDENAGGVCGHIISLIYKGDHYKYTVRTETEDDFTIDDEWLWNENDYVSIVIDTKDIKLQRKNKEDK
ncbi:MAG: ABC transporter ATP-binding protein [Lachnospiraceae bacterium]|nr:ABC transporter ATP-binding protein [Lachnospiraceae bacterium]